MKIVVLCLMVLVLPACALSPPRNDVDLLFADSLFGAPPTLPQHVDIFALSDEVRAQIRADVTQRGRGRSRLMALQESIATLKIEYDAETTRSASEAFAARAGNCLSLVILAGALAAEMEVPIVFQSVHGYDTWSRSRGIAFLSGHVNLMLGSDLPSTRFGMQVFDRPVVIDFAEDAHATVRRSRPIGASTVVAMFYNNRAAEVLLDSGPQDAYWWAREAIRAEPTFMSAYNTLAVIYRRSGRLVEAARVLNVALQREPGNPQMLTNLVAVLELQGRSSEAQATRRLLAKVSEYPPFWFLDQGNAALESGDAEGALAWYQREMERIPYDHELHFAIAVASARLGHADEVRAHLQLARDHSSTRERRAIYMAKLRTLEAQTLH